MQPVPALYYRHRQRTFTEVVLEQLRTWPWAEMAPNPEPPADCTPRPLDRERWSPHPLQVGGGNPAGNLRHPERTDP